MLHDPVTSTYPPCQRYTLRFLQRYLEELESNPSTVDIADELCQEISILVRYPTQDLYHLSFRNNDIVVTCRVARYCNEVGLKLWEAAYCLTEFSSSNPTLFQNKKILELGSGGGLVGLFIGACLKPKSVYMTDYAKVLANLAYNVDIHKHLYGEIVKAGNLDWENLSEEGVIEIQNCDMILCADCVYDKTVFSCIIRILNLFFVERSRKAIFCNHVEK